MNQHGCVHSSLGTLMIWLTGTVCFDLNFLVGVFVYKHCMTHCTSVAVCCLFVKGNFVSVVVRVWQYRPLKFSLKLMLTFSQIACNYLNQQAGDLMWTIEPIVVLSSPFYFQFLAPKQTKEKAD